MSERATMVRWRIVGLLLGLPSRRLSGDYLAIVTLFFLQLFQTLATNGDQFLFGAGNACQTNNTDAESDGVTNNGGAATTDTLGYCSACNVHASAYADDDGLVQ